MWRRLHQLRTCGATQPVAWCWTAAGHGHALAPGGNIRVALAAGSKLSVAVEWTDSVGVTFNDAYGKTTPSIDIHPKAVVAGIAEHVDVVVHSEAAVRMVVPQMCNLKIDGADSAIELKGKIEGDIDVIVFGSEGSISVQKARGPTIRLCAPTSVSVQELVEAQDLTITSAQISGKRLMGSNVHLTGDTDIDIAALYCSTGSLSARVVQLGTAQGSIKVTSDTLSIASLAGQLDASVKGSVECQVQQLTGPCTIEANENVDIGVAPQVMCTVDLTATGQASVDPGLDLQHASITPDGSSVTGVLLPSDEAGAIVDTATVDVSTSGKISTSGRDMPSWFAMAQPVTQLDSDLDAAISVTATNIALSSRSWDPLRGTIVHKSN